jgi:hypothetical protein
VTTQHSTTLDLSPLDLVRQATQRGRDRIAAAAATAAADRAAYDAQLAAAWDAANHELGLPSWTLQFIDTPDPGADPAACTVRRLDLPACSPIVIKRPTRYAPWDTAKAQAQRAAALSYDEEWFIACTLGPEWPLDLLDLAIADAAEAGPEWHALSLEAARRNELGLEPRDLNPPAPAKPETPDLIDQTHVLLRALTGEVQLSNSGSETVDCAVVLTTAVMAVAEQLRRLADMREADHAPFGF